MSSSSDKTRVGRLRSFRARSKSPIPSKSSSNSNATKKVLTFQELQEMNGNLNSDNSKRRPSIASPIVTTSRTASPKVAAESSPIARRIRQQILHTNQAAKAVPAEKQPSRKGAPSSFSAVKRSIGTTNAEVTALDRRQRVERLKNRREIRSSASSRTITPISAPPVDDITANSDLKTPSGANEVNAEAFFTPSPATVQSSASKAASSVRPPLSSQKSASFKMVTRTGSLTPPLGPSGTKKKAIKVIQTSSSSGESSNKRTPLRSLSNTPTSESEGFDDEISTRRNLDKRSARLRYSGEFSAQIAKYKESPSSRQLSPLPNLSSRLAHSNGSSVQVYVRKRPIFAHETTRGDFDVCQPLDDDESAAAAAVVVYRTHMAADMKTKLIQPVSFAGLTAAFDSDVDSQEVYDRAVAPLVETVINRQSPAATLLMFGQTGSGKTYTMSACQERVSRQIFAAGKPISVQVQSIELAGKICRDLIGAQDEDNDESGKSTPDVKILEQKDGSVHFKNATSVAVKTAEELSQLLADVNGRRSTQSTLQNDVSSRSHAIYQIRVIQNASASTRRGSVLTLVDCAGTERRNDSIYHCKERQAESAQINASLHALKECIRKRSLSQHVPYRSNLLTRILRECLESEQAPLVVIATVAPNATDTEHTIETLKTVSILTNATFTEGEIQKVEEESPAPVPRLPKQWSRCELLDWMSRKHFLSPTVRSIRSGLNGRHVMGMSKIQLKNAFYDGDVKGGERAESLFNSLRAEGDRVRLLDFKRRCALKKASQRVGAGQ